MKEYLLPLSAYFSVHWRIVFLLFFCLFSSMASAVPISSPPSESHVKPTALMPITVQLNWHHQFQFAGFYAALKQGYYQQAGLEVTIKDWQSGQNLVEAVASNHVQFATAYGMALVDYIKGSPIKLVMVNLQNSPSIILAHAPIKTLADLNGQVVHASDSLQLKMLLHKAALEGGRVRTVPANGRLEDFIAGKVKFQLAYATNEPVQLARLNVPFAIVSPRDYGIYGYEDLVITSATFAKKYPDKVKAFRRATILGWQYAMAHPTEMVDYILAHYPTVKSREDLLGEAALLPKYLYSLNNTIGDIAPSYLTAMLQEALTLGLITASEFSQFEPTSFMVQDLSFKLTNVEKAYLQQHPVIKLANDINWAPFEYIDEAGQYTGLAAEYFKIMEQKLGVAFKPVIDKSWSEVVDLTQKGELSIYSCAVATSERKKYMNFTQPYLSFPVVFVGRKGEGFLQDVTALSGKVVAAVKGYSVIEQLKKSNPTIKILEVRAIDEGLKSVINGKAAVYIGNLAVINYQIEKLGLVGLSIVGEYSNHFDLAIGVQKDDPVLFQIMQKALASISPQEKQIIYNHWVHLDVVKHLDKAQIIQYALYVFSIVLSLVLVIVILNRLRRQKQRYLDEINELTLATALEVKDLKILWVSDSFAHRMGFTQTELLGKDYREFVQRDKWTDEKIQSVLALLNKQKVWTGEVSNTTKQGETVYFKLTISLEEDLFGRPKALWMRREDITDQKRLEQLSQQDALTELYNRRSFNHILPAELNRIKREQTSLCGVMLDIDWFKRINDDYGHQCGDEVLVKVSAVLKEMFSRSNEFVFRMGGEEFLILTHFDTVQAMEEYLNHCRQKVIDLQIENKNTPLKVLTLSMGAIFYDKNHIPNPNDFYKQLDELLYEAKENGRNQVKVQEVS